MIDSMRSWILLLGVFMVLVILTEAVPHKSKKSSSSSDESAKDYNRRLKEKSDSSSEEKKNRALKKDHHHHDKKKKDKKEKDKDEAKGSKNRNGDKKDDSSSSSEEEVHRVGDFDNRKWSPPAYKRSGEVNLIIYFTFFTFTVVTSNIKELLLSYIADFLNFVCLIVLLSDGRFVYLSASLYGQFILFNIKLENYK